MQGLNIRTYMYTSALKQLQVQVSIFQPCNIYSKPWFVFHSSEKFLVLLEKWRGIGSNLWLHSINPYLGLLENYTCLLKHYTKPYKTQQLPISTISRCIFASTEKQNTRKIKSSTPPLVLFQCQLCVLTTLLLPNWKKNKDACIGQPRKVSYSSIKSQTVIPLIIKALCINTQILRMLYSFIYITTSSKIPQTWVPHLVSLQVAMPGTWHGGQLGTHRSRNRGRGGSSEHPITSLSTKGLCAH